MKVSGKIEERSLMREVDMLKAIALIAYASAVSRFLVIISYIEL
jgi:hypothetical protein